MAEGPKNVEAATAEVGRYEFSGAQSFADRHRFAQRVIPVSFKSIGAVSTVFKKVELRDAPWSLGQGSAAEEVMAKARRRPWQRAKKWKLADKSSPVLKVSPIGTDSRRESFL